MLTDVKIRTSPSQMRFFFTNIDIEKLVTPPGGHIFKTVK